MKRAKIHRSVIAYDRKAGKVRRFRSAFEAAAFYGISADSVYRSIRLHRPARCGASFKPSTATREREKGQILKLRRKTSNSPTEGKKSKYEAFMALLAQKGGDTI